MSTNLAAMLAGAGARASGGKAKSAGIECSDPAILETAKLYLAGKGKEEEGKSEKDQAAMILKPALLRVWLAGNAGRPAPESSVRLLVPMGTPPVPTKMTASFAAQWFPTADVNLAAIGVPADLVRKKLNLTIDGDLIPAEKVEDVVRGIVGVLSAAGCGDSLGFKLIDYPKPEFAAARHTRLTPDQNEALELAGLNTRVSIK